MRSLFLTHPPRAPVGDDQSCPLQLDCPLSTDTAIAQQVTTLSAQQAHRISERARGPALAKKANALCRGRYAGRHLNTADICARAVAAR